MSNKVKFSKTDAKMKQMIGRKKKISSKRIDTYDLVFREIHELTGLTPTQIIEIAKKEEKPFITEDGLVDIIDINDRRITQIQYEYDADLRNNPKNGRTPSEKTLRLKGSTYRSFLKEFDIQLPKPIEYDIPKKQVRDDEIPSWEDVQKAMTLAKSPRDKAAIAFAATTGIRVSDIVGFKIKDLIKACSIYFSPSEEHTIENLLDKNPDNIMPCWEFTPKKTKKHENLAITFNTAETTNYIFDYLKYRIHLDKENDGDGKLMDDDPLFASQRGNFLHENRLEYQIRLINDRMGGEKDRNGLYSKFRLHNLRALFKTTCRRAFKEVQIDSTKNFDGDIVDLFTGHSSEGLRHVYEAVPRDKPESYLRKAYEAILNHLSIQPTEVKDFKTIHRQEWEKEKDEIEKRQNLQEVEYKRKMIEKDKQINTLENKLEEAEKRIDEIKDEVNHKKYILPDAQIGAIIMEHIGVKSSEDYLISLIATKEAFKDKTSFENTSEYLDRLVKKAKVIINLSDKDLMELQVETAFELAKGEPNYTIIQIMDEVIEIINNNNIPEMKNMSRFDLQNAIEFQIINSDYDMEDLTDTDKNAIARDVILSYI